MKFVDIDFDDAGRGPLVLDFIRCVISSIWILVEGQNSRRRIMELKQYVEPATAIYQPQPSVEQWLREIRRVFWPGLDGSDYDLINLAGEGWFWLREARVVDRRASKSSSWTNSRHIMQISLASRTAARHKPRPTVRLSRRTPTHSTTRPKRSKRLTSHLHKRHLHKSQLARLCKN